MKDLLVRLVERLIGVAYNNICSSSSSSYKTRKETSEVFLSLKLLHESFLLDPISRASLEFLLNKIQDSICHEGYFKYYMCFHYLPQAVFEKSAEEFSRLIYESNVNISCFRCKMYASNILNFSLDSSADNYFFSKGDKITKAINNYIKYPFEFDVSSFIYMLLNYYQALVEYITYADKSHIRTATELISECNSTFKQMLLSKDIAAYIVDNSRLSVFWNSILPTELNLTVPEFVLTTPVSENHRWIIFAMFKKSPAIASALIDHHYAQIINGIYTNLERDYLCVRIMCNKLKYINDHNLQDIEMRFPNMQGDSRVRYNLSYFFKNYNNINTIDCSQADISSLESYDDGILRGKLSKCMQNVDFGELERQIQKVHGPLEISDIDLQFIENGAIKYLCMPVKTGREITSLSVADSYMYQLIKPFSHFGSQCMVVFITAKKCSQGLETYIQRMSIKQPSWRIEVIQEKQLCKLLKLNGQL